MNSSEIPNSVDALQRIKHEIERLTSQQSEALKTATFVGMTAAEAETYDARRTRISELVERLRLLEACKQ